MLTFLLTQNKSPAFWWIYHHCLADIISWSSCMAVHNCKTKYFFLWIELNACDSGPCENSGTCTKFGAGYFCSCAEGYEGDNCQTGEYNDKSVHVGCVLFSVWCSSILFFVSCPFSDPEPTARATAGLFGLLPSLVLPSLTLSFWTERMKCCVCERNRFFLIDKFMFTRPSGSWPVHFSSRHR